MIETVLRRADAGDARIVAQVHSDAWRETYADMMPAQTLAARDLDEWTRRWRERLADRSDPAAATFLALDAAGAPAGVAHCRRQSSEKLRPLGFEGEIACLYLLRRLQRRGAGRGLLAKMGAHLLANRCKSASVWVFRDAAHARRFYEALGAAPAGVEGFWEIYGMTLSDMAYGWRDLGALAVNADCAKADARKPPA
jgi:GNAT superfamily N-acetyltransferase